MKKLNNKGFTLIEIVIVIVIIAILAAMLVPSLTQWIDKSKKKTFFSACGTVRTAVSAQLSEEYAVDSTKDSISDISSWETITADVGKTVAYTANAASTAATDGFLVSGSNADNITINDGKWYSTFNGTAWSDPAEITAQN